MKIYAGNLPYDVTEEELEESFSDFGEVTAVNIVLDKETGKSKGFAFVEMSDEVDAKEAMHALHESPMKGRNIKVNRAQHRYNRSSKGKGRSSGEQKS